METQLDIVWTSRAMAAAGVGALVLMLFQPARGGEVGTPGQKCDLGAANSTCEWKPKTCPPPSAPALAAASNMASYNTGVERYNQYVREAEAYMACITKEGSADIHAFPAVVKKAVDAQQHDIEANLQTAKGALEASRHSIPSPKMGMSAPSHDPAH
jgi:hypothetical protein